MKLLTLVPLASLIHSSLSAPAPALAPAISHNPDLLPRQASTAVVATATPGATDPSPARTLAVVQGCSNINLGGVTENDIINGVCKPFTLIFARGTSERGNIGGIVGPPLVAALKSRIGANNVAVQGVSNHRANVVELLEGGSATGGANMADVSFHWL